MIAPPMRDDDVVLEGIRAVAASASGRAVVVRDFSDAGDVPAGRIVVAPHATPDAILVMERALGLVFETGGPASHAAILARELGCACVVGVHGAIADGAYVTIDGPRGRVRVARD